MEVRYSNEKSETKELKCVPYLGRSSKLRCILRSKRCERKVSNNLQSLSDHWLRCAHRQPHASLPTRFYTHADSIGDYFEQLYELDAAVVGNSELATEMGVICWHEARELHAKIGSVA
jgi:hypothetical protein